ncbi:4718_t:CDS:2 [Entrophospora sp. SA101]|nr:4718_t:CDS:2 [Entrophospora sp. SA101]
MRAIMIIILPIITYQLIINFPYVGANLIAFNKDDVLSAYENVDIRGINQTGYEKIVGTFNIARFLVPIASFKDDEDNNLRCKIDPKSYDGVDVLVISFEDARSVGNCATYADILQRNHWPDNNVVAVNRPQPAGNTNVLTNTDAPANTDTFTTNDNTPLPQTEAAPQTTAPSQEQVPTLTDTAPPLQTETASQITAPSQEKIPTPPQTETASDTFFVDGTLSIFTDITSTQTKTAPSTTDTFIVSSTESVNGNEQSQAESRTVQQQTSQSPSSRQQQTPKPSPTSSKDKILDVTLSATISSVVGVEVGVGVKINKKRDLNLKTPQMILFSSTNGGDPGIKELFSGDRETLKMSMPILSLLKLEDVITLQGILDKIDHVVVTPESGPWVKILSDTEWLVWSVIISSLFIGIVFLAVYYLVKTYQDLVAFIIVTVDPDDIYEDRISLSDFKKLLGISYTMESVGLVVLGVEFLAFGWLIVTALRKRVSQIPLRRNRLRTSSKVIVMIISILTSIVFFIFSGSLSFFVTTVANFWGAQITSNLAVVLCSVIIILVLQDKTIGKSLSQSNFTNKKKKSVLSAITLSDDDNNALEEEEEIDDNGNNNFPTIISTSPGETSMIDIPITPSSISPLPTIYSSTSTSSHHSDN